MKKSSHAVFAFAALFYFAPSFILGGADYLRSFSPARRTASAIREAATQMSQFGEPAGARGSACCSDSSWAGTAKTDVGHGTRPSRTQRTRR